MKFKSIHSYNQFSRHVKSENRYHWNDETIEFLESVSSTCEDRVLVLEAGSKLWRSQLDCSRRPLPGTDDDEAVPFPEDRMKPLKDEAREGRVNPKGIACLYASMEKETAMREVRPWIGSRISIGLFKTLKKLTLVDCSKHARKHIQYYFKDPESVNTDDATWAFIDSAFSDPITDSTERADYAPTQIIAELFRKKNYDGIVYQSSIGDGKNVALFDIDSVMITHIKLSTVKKIEYSFK